MPKIETAFRPTFALAAEALEYGKLKRLRAASTVDMPPANQRANRASETITCNGQPLDVPPGTTVAQLLERLQVDPRRVAVEVNRELVPRTHHARHALRAGDVVEIVTLVGGG